MATRLTSAEKLTAKLAKQADLQAEIKRLQKLEAKRIADAQTAKARRLGELVLATFGDLPEADLVALLTAARPNAQSAPSVARTYD